MMTITKPIHFHISCAGCPVGRPGENRSAGFEEGLASAHANLNGLLLAKTLW